MNQKRKPRNPLGASKATHELGQGQVKCNSENLLGTQARLFLACFQIRNEGSAQPRMNGKVCLGPAPLFAELPHALPESHDRLLRLPRYKHGGILWATFRL